MCGQLLSDLGADMIKEPLGGRSGASSPKSVPLRGARSSPHVDNRAPPTPTARIVGHSATPACGGPFRKSRDSLLAIEADLYHWSRSSLDLESVDSGSAYQRANPFAVSGAIVPAQQSCHHCSAAQLSGDAHLEPEPTCAVAHFVVGNRTISETCSRTRSRFNCEVLRAASVPAAVSILSSSTRRPALRLEYRGALAALAHQPHRLGLVLIRKPSPLASAAILHDPLLLHFRASRGVHGNRGKFNREQPEPTRPLATQTCS